ncbi:unnamed protein product [Clavelina lepadiformis]|uniref:PX domain-containing protein n=1 Tax=Clavelina lepadiformis TaxID=159417 RepID=A0ABP0FFX1_CLALP
MVTESLVYVTESKQVDDYTEYTIEVHHVGFIWTVKHRYSEFKEIHDVLRSKDPSLEKSLLPPKKIFGKMSATFIDKRRVELEAYLQVLVQQKYINRLPRPLRKFLHFHLYDVEMICQYLAVSFYENGDKVLESGSSYTLTPLELWCITERLMLKKPQDVDDPKYDFGHVLDFVQKLKHLHIKCTKGFIDASNVVAEDLLFDLSVFHSLQQLIVDDCGPNQVTCLASLHNTISSLSVHQSLKDLQSALTGGCGVEDYILNWSKLITADFSNNSISSLDASLKLLTCVEFLDLSKNNITKIENLEHLSSLTFLDLSSNKIEDISLAHAKLGNVKTLNLSQNRLHSLEGLGKLYSLETVDISENFISKITEVDHIASLPCLAKINLANNSISHDFDYRTQTLSRFGSRACEVCLDNVESTQKELDTAAVLHAIVKSRRASSQKSNIASHRNFGISSPIRIHHKKDHSGGSNTIMSAPGRLRYSNSSENQLLHTNVPQSDFGSPDVYQQPLPVSPKDNILSDSSLINPFKASSQSSQSCIDAKLETAELDKNESNEEIDNIPPVKFSDPELSSQNSKIVLIEQVKDEEEEDEIHPTSEVADLSSEVHQDKGHLCYNAGEPKENEQLVSGLSELGIDDGEAIFQSSSNQLKICKDESKRQSSVEDLKPLLEIPTDVEDIEENKDAVTTLQDKQSIESLSENVAISSEVTEASAHYILENKSRAHTAPLYRKLHGEEQCSWPRSSSVNGESGLFPIKPDFNSNINACPQNIDLQNNDSSVEPIESILSVSERTTSNRTEYFKNDDIQQKVNDSSSHSLSNPALHTSLCRFYVSPVMNLQFASPPMHHLSMYNQSQLLHYFTSSVGEVSSETLLYVTWCDVVFHGRPRNNVTCAIFLSTRALYLLMDVEESIFENILTLETFDHCRDPSKLRSLRLPLTECATSTLSQVVVGLFKQYVRITGSTSNDTFTFLTRSSKETDNITRYLLQVLDGSSQTTAKSDVESILDRCELLEDFETTLSRSGVRFTLCNEESMTEFNFASAEIQRQIEKRSSSNEFELVLYSLVHLVHENGSTLLKSFILTSDYCCLCEEDLVSYPLPDFALTPPECQRHTSLQIASLADVQYLQIDGVVGFDVTICMQFNLDSSNPAQWRLSFRDYTEREKMIRLFSHQFEAVNSEKLPINVCPSFSP